MAIGEMADVVVHARGSVSPTEHAYAHRRFARFQRLLNASAMSAKVDIVVPTSNGSEEMTVARVELDADGHRFRADAEGDSVRAAVDQLEGRLRREIQQVGLDWGGR